MVMAQQHDVLVFPMWRALRQAHISNRSKGIPTKIDGSAMIYVWWMYSINETSASIVDTSFVLHTYSDESVPPVTKLPQPMHEAD